MKPLLAFPKAQYLGHLRFRVAAGAGGGHRQRSGNAVRGEEEIARAAPELGVEVASEGGVALHQRLSLAGLACASKAAWEGRQEQAGQNQCAKARRGVHSRTSCVHTLFDGKYA